MKTSLPFQELVAAFQSLPSVGPKTALRMVTHLLQHDRNAAHAIASTLHTALDTLVHCTRCNTFTEATTQVCETCSDSQRDTRLLCIVESVADQITVEQSLSYQGLYFVLMGKLSPLDGMGAEAFALPALLQRAQDPLLTEIIIATPFTTEGEATAHVIAQKLNPLKTKGIRISRLAKGIPVGAELEYVDLPTLAHSLRERSAVL